jgi:hypothetical protein
MDKVKMIKKDAKISMTFGTGFIEKLQKLFYHLTINVKMEDIKKYQELVENKQPFTEEWMEHLTTVSMLLRELENNAEKQGFTYEEDLQSIIPDDSSLPDQFPEQPE